MGGEKGNREGDKEKRLGEREQIDEDRMREEVMQEREEKDIKCVEEKCETVDMSTGEVCPALLQPYNIFYSQQRKTHPGHPKLSPSVLNLQCRTSVSPLWQ